MEAVGVYKEPGMLITHFERYQHFNVILVHDLAFEILTINESLVHSLPLSKLHGNTCSYSSPLAVELPSFVV